MTEALRDPRFVTYLILTNVALVALALAGPIWFVSGLGAFAVLEVASTLRSTPEPRPAVVRTRRR